MKKYVVLEHLQGRDSGFRFWSSNSEDCEYLATGERVYEKVLETDDPEEAKDACLKINPNRARIQE